VRRGGKAENVEQPLFKQPDYPPGVNSFVLVLKNNAFIKTAFAATFIVVQAMLTVPLFHRPDRSAIKARYLLHKELEFVFFSCRKEHHFHLPSPNGMKNALAS
jgi:hypothetical protein